MTIQNYLNFCEGPLTHKWNSKVYIYKLVFALRKSLLQALNNSKMKIYLRVNFDVSSKFSKNLSKSALEGARIVRIAGEVKKYVNACLEKILEPSAKVSQKILEPCAQIIFTHK